MCNAAKPGHRAAASLRTDHSEPATKPILLGGRHKEPSLYDKGIKAIRLTDALELQTDPFEDLDVNIIISL